MDRIILFILFVYGTIFGSFFNVVGLRVPQQTLFKQKRSYCDECQRTLKWKELIPILSYVFQKGRCKKCGQKILILYPVMEVVTGFLFAYSYHYFGWSPSFLLSLCLMGLIIPVTVSDLIYQKIPNRILLFFTPLLVVYRMLYPVGSLWNSVLGGLLAFLLIYLIIYLSKGGMGMGDLKYYTLFGFVFGWSHFLLLFLLSIFYGVIAGISIIKVRKVGIRTKIAFGPYIGLAALTVLYFGEGLIQWYVQLFI